MKTRSPFLALMKLEVTRSSTLYGNPLAWILAAVLLACNLIPALLIWLKPELPLFLLFQESWASMTIFWWLTILMAECSNTLVRGVWGVLAPLGIPPDHNWDEFLGTRAIDRALHFRAKTVMLAGVLVLPMLLNFGLICLVSRQFPPGINGFLGAPPVSAFEAPMVEVATAFGWAMIWGSATAIVLAQGYYGLVSQWLAQRGTVPAAVLAFLPIPLVLAGFWVFRLDRAWESDWEHDRITPIVCFIARHGVALKVALLALAVPVQRFCERRFAAQEVL